MERMFHPKKPSTMNSHDRPMCVQGDSGLVLTTDPKPRLRWTVELHERFVDAVAQLGGPDKATPKTIMRVMGVKGLTLYRLCLTYITSIGEHAAPTYMRHVRYPPLYHLKSHLQKFRLGKQPHKEFNEHSIKDGMRASALELQRNTGTSSSMNGRNMNEMQMEVHRRLHEQLEVQKHLQLRIEAQGKYMQSILEKAYHSLAGENMASVATNFKGIGSQVIPNDMKEFNNPPLINFPPFQDLNICGSGEEQLEGFMPNNNENFFDGKKRPNPNYNGSGKSPLFWNSDDLRLHDLGGITTSSCIISPQDVPFKGDNIAQLSMDRGDDHESDNLSSEIIYDTNQVNFGEKKFDASMKLGINGRPSPNRGNLSPMINTSTMLAQGRSSPFG